MASKKAQNTKPKTLKPIKPSIAIERDLRQRLRDISNEINKSVLWWASATFNKAFNKNVSKQLAFEFNSLLDYHQSKINESAKSIARKLASQIEKNVNSQYLKQGLDFDIKRRSQGIKNQLGATYERSLDLIKSIPSQIIQSYKQSFLSGVNDFNREAIAKRARQIGKVSEKRAKFIARDQTHKATADYAMARAKSLGFEYYIWTTSKDERVSTGAGGHKQLEGRIYRYDKDTAIVDSYGNVGHCGTRPNCRCVPLTLILEPTQEVKLVKDSKAGDYYIIVNKRV